MQAHFGSASIVCTLTETEVDLQKKVMSRSVLGHVGVPLLSMFVELTGERCVTVPAPEREPITGVLVHGILPEMPHFLCSLVLHPSSKWMKDGEVFDYATSAP